MQQEKFPNLEKKTFDLVSVEEFIKFRNMLENDLLAFLTLHTIEDYGNKETRLFLSQDLKSGFGVNPDGGTYFSFCFRKKEREGSCC